MLSATQANPSSPESLIFLSHFGVVQVTNRAGLAITAYTHIRNVLGYNLGLDIGSPDRNVSGFPQPPPPQQMPE
jgi:hypothetical protein